MNKYSVDKVSSFLNRQMMNEEKINIKEKTIQTKEEALMYAAAILYAKNEEFPYEIQMYEETVKTAIAEISDMTIIKK